jgi:hypothetical protein
MMVRAQMSMANRPHRHLLAVILVARLARRIVVRQGRRDTGGEDGRGRRGDQKTVHSLFL